MIIILLQGLSQQLGQKLRLLSQYVTSVTANLERGEGLGIIVSFVNVSEGNNTLDVLNTKDETRQRNPFEVSELSVPGTHFDRRQSPTHHN